MLAGTDIGEIIENLLIEGRLEAYSSYVNVTEAEYIICRKIGHELARMKVQNLIDSNFIEFIEVEPLIHIASRIKCDRSIALADCFCIAVAETTTSTALFRFKEKELTKEMKKKPFEVQTRFLEDLL